MAGKSICNRFKDLPTGSTIVHHLDQGMSDCVISSMYGVPDKWPQGHSWSPDWDMVTCSKCRVSAGKNYGRTKKG